MFSKTCEYGIRAVIYILSKSQEQQRTSLKDIALEIDSPEHFTAKILQQLVKNGIIDSLKGPSGGFFIPLELIDRVKLIDIVETLDGDKIFNGCGLGLEACNAEKPCPLHDHFLQVRNDLRHMLETTTVAQLSQKLDEGAAFLRR